MDFRLSEEQLMLKDMVRKIAEKEFAPRAAELDEREEFSWENKKVLDDRRNGP
ncbi:MAG: acyl-CoA dehydrogenase family protein [Desulfobacteraceae bacterium]|nr:acyl-CoA dehydrogenase family protein [Desulfobacteraceae bacterium]